MENFMKMFNKKLSRNDLKIELKEVLRNQCRREKIMMSNCMCSLEDDAVEVMSDFGKKIDSKCKPQRTMLEQCVIKNISKK